MPMYPCSQCHENSWAFSPLPDNRMGAACKNCNNLVSWEVKPKPKPSPAKERDKCGQCEGLLFWRSKKLTLKRLNNPFHFCRWLHCDKCAFVKFDEIFKTAKGEECDCEIAEELLPDGGILRGEIDDV